MLRYFMLEQLLKIPEIDTEQNGSLEMKQLNMKEKLAFRSALKKGSRSPRFVE